MGIKQKQKGFVLVISLVFLVALTALASVLMQNSTSDIKVSSANADKTTAVQEAISATDELIFKQVNKIDGSNNFSHRAGAYSQNVAINDVNTTARIDFGNENGLEVSCPHMKFPSSSAITCNVLKVEVIKNYGRNNNQSITVNSGISQLVLDTGS